MLWLSVSQLVVFLSQRSLVHIKVATHLVLRTGGGQVDTRGLHLSSGGNIMGVTGKDAGHTLGILITVKTNRTVISCVSVEKLTWPLILVCCVFGLYQFCINGGKCSQWNFLAL